MSDAADTKIPGLTFAEDWPQSSPRSGTTPAVRRSSQMSCRG